MNRNTHTYTLGTTTVTILKIIRSAEHVRKKTYAFFLDIQKAYMILCGNNYGLWYKLWDMGVMGRM